MEPISETPAAESADPYSSSRAPRIGAWLVRLTAFSGTLICVATLARLLATYWWFADLLTQFTVQYVFLLTPAFLVMVAFRRWRWALLFMLALIVNAWPVSAYYRPVPVHTASRSDYWQLRILTHNVLRSNDEFQKVIDLIERTDPDIIALQEVDHRWMDALAELNSDYPHVHFVEYPGNFGIAILCKAAWDAIDVQLFGPYQLPSIHARFSRSGRQALELVNTHPLPPEGRKDSEYRNGQLLLTAHELDQSRSRIVVGDFNLTPWSPWFREFLRRGNLVDTGKGWGVEPTWYAFPTWLGGVRIDYVLVSPDIIVDNFDVGPDTGSDHRALVVEIRVPDSH